MGARIFIGALMALFYGSVLAAGVLSQAPSQIAKPFCASSAPTVQIGTYTVLYTSAVAGLPPTAVTECDSKNCYTKTISYNSNNLPIAGCPILQ